MTIGLKMKWEEILSLSQLPLVIGAWFCLVVTALIS